jgi:hypothetical protein
VYPKVKKNRGPPVQVSSVAGVDDTTFAALWHGIKKCLPLFPRTLPHFGTVLESVYHNLLRFRAF